MKTFFIISLSLILSIGATAQSFITQAKPTGEKLWGYFDKNGTMIIDAKYKKCYKFSDNGLAPIYESKKFSFINTSGQQITTQLQGFSLIEGFMGIGGLQGYNDGLIAVMIDKKWGFLDSEGNIAIQLKYDKVSSFNNSAAIARIGDVFFVINIVGEERKVEVSNLVDVKNIKEGLAPFTTSDKKSGFIDTNGKIAIPANFVNVGYFSDGVAWAKSTNEKVGFIDIKGDWVIEPQFDVAKNFDPVSGLARIKSDGIWMYVSKTGEKINVDTETYGDFSEGLAKGKKDGKTGYFDNMGTWVIAPEYNGGRDFKNGFAAVKQGNKWGFINKTGEWVISPQFAAVKDMEKVD